LGAWSVGDALPLDVVINLPQDTVVWANAPVANNEREASADRRNFVCGNDIEGI